MTDRDRRRSICLLCPDLEHGGGHHWCEALDDTFASVYNCPRTRMARWLARLARGEATCGKWARSPCEACAIADPLGGQRGADQAAYLAAWQELRARPMPPPAGHGDGVVYTLYGQRYVPQVLVAVRLAREIGLTLPIQVWWRDVRDLGSIPDYATTVDADAFQAAHPSRRADGWAFKNYALAHSGLRRGLSLDGDAYLVADPRPLFDLLEEHPFLWWENLGGFGDNDNPNLIRMFSGSTPAVPSVQGGHYLVHLEKAWRELMLAKWANDHSDFFWQALKNERGYGNSDEATWRLTLNLGTIPARCLGPANWKRLAFVCEAPGGQPMIVHRCRGKLLADREMRWHDGLPMERRVRELFDALGLAVYKPKLTRREIAHKARGR